MLPNRTPPTSTHLPVRGAAALAGVALGLLGSSEAAAAWPNDVRLSQLGSFDGEPVTDVGATRAAYEQVVREFGASIANRPSVARTSGLHGFDLSINTSVSWIDDGVEGSLKPAAWERVHPEGDPNGTVFSPSLTLRKGLPLGLEGGATLGYIGGTSQTTFGAFGRWGIVEGYKQYPDLTVQVGYTGLVGNEELDLGVVDTSFTIGYTLPFGRSPGMNSAKFSPYLGAGWLKIKAAPRMGEAEREALGLREISGFKGSDAFAKGLSPATIHIGARLQSGDVQVQAATLLTTTQDRLTPGVNVGIGYVY